MIYAWILIQADGRETIAFTFNGKRGQRFLVYDSLDRAKRAAHVAAAVSQLTGRPARLAEYRLERIIPGAIAGETAAG